MNGERITHVRLICSDWRTTLRRNMRIISMPGRPGGLRLLSSCPDLSTPFLSLWWVAAFP